MNRNAYIFSFLVLTLAGLVGCSSAPPAKDSKKAGTALDKIQGKSQIVQTETTQIDSALNAGGPSVYIWEGARRYRLFFKTAVEVVPGKEYIVEGVNAQRVIDELGDPDQGKNGYPLPESCDRVVKTAWSGQAFDVSDGQATVLRTRVKRYPARPVFLVNRLTPVPEGGAASANAKKASEEKDIPEVTVAADKQRALLIEGPAVLPAPLWQPAGGTVRCKVYIDKEGKISELGTGEQLCEAVPWSKFRYQSPVQGGHPVTVSTEVEVRFEPRK
jgi:hypothetical protein